MHNENIKSNVISDYFKSQLSVEQISAKYNISRRSVYNWTHSERKTRKSKNIDISIRFTKTELTVISAALTSYSNSENVPDLKAMANTLRNRIIDKLETIKAMETTNN